MDAVDVVNELPPTDGELLPIGVNPANLDAVNVINEHLSTHGELLPVDVNSENLNMSCISEDKSDNDSENVEEPNTLLNTAYDGLSADGAGYGFSEADNAALNNEVSEPEVEVTSELNTSRNSKGKVSNVMVAICFMLV